MVTSNGGIFNSAAQNNNWLFPVWSEVAHGNVAGPFIVGNAPNDPLPIELLSWKVHQTETGMIALWSTAQELDNDFFTIEASVDGVDFVEVAHLDVKENNSFSLKEYSLGFNYIAETPVSYYRLKQTDLNGDFSYSEIVAVLMNQSIKKEDVVVYPNPTKDRIISIRNAKDYSIELLRAEGSKITLPIAIERLNDFDKISFPEDLDNGVYVLVLKKNNSIIQKKLVLN